MPNVNFHPISLNDKNDIRSAVSQTECRNCDLNFMNLMSWRFLYDTMKDGSSFDSKVTDIWPTSCQWGRATYTTSCRPSWKMPNSRERLS